MDAYLLCTGITYSVCEMLIANKLIDSKEDIYNLFRRSSTNKFQISETDYKKFFLYIIVCTSIIQIYYRRGELKANLYS